MMPQIEGAIERLNSEGRYQKLVIAYLFFIAAFVNFMLIGPTFIFMNPLFQCTFQNDPVD